MRLILASKSPRRREILETMGVQFEVITADTDESCAGLSPAATVEELALRKGRAVQRLLEAQGQMLEGTVILSSDTVVAVDEKILGKPRDEAEAREMLMLLSGRTHEVVSGICLIGDGKEAVAHEVTRVAFEKLDGETVADYIRRTNPYDKAGAYAIQGLASAYVTGIQGCYFNVVGLPVHRLNQLFLETYGKRLF